MSEHRRRIGVPGVRVGHWTDAVAQTGCTVVELPENTVASCEVRGGAPASRELALLAPDKSVTRIDAVLLTGGSAFGLAAADGVMRFYEERGHGVATPTGPVPIVPTMALFDLAAGDGSVRPTSESGYLAAQTAHAATDGHVAVGPVGAGTGAYASQWRGPEGRRRGGIGYAEHRSGDLVVGVLCVVNAFGDVDDGTGGVSLEAADALAPHFGLTGEPPQPDNRSRGRPEPGNESRTRPQTPTAPHTTHTTIGVVLTNAVLDKVGCQIVAQGAHDGLARAITPPHTRVDGDGFIAAATGQVTANVDAVRLLALAATVDAIRSTVQPGREGRPSVARSN